MKEQETSFNFVLDHDELDLSHRYLDGSGQFPMIPVSQLVDVAKHLAPGGDPALAIRQAHALICEAKILEQQIDAWNRGEFQSPVDRVIGDAMANSRSDKHHSGQVGRIKAIVSVEKAEHRPCAESTARELWKKWCEHSVRLADYERAIPWLNEPVSLSNDLRKQLVENGWLAKVKVNGDKYVIVPEKTAPLKVRKARKGDQHPTGPYWKSKDVWWPEADGAEVTKLETYYLTTDKSTFIDDRKAWDFLTKFLKWREITLAIKAQKKAPKVARNKEGQFGKDN